MLKRLLSNLPILWLNWVSLFGTIIVTLSGGSLLLAVVYDLFMPISNLYATSFLFLIVPVFFVAGLLIIPVGYWWERRKRKFMKTSGSSLQSPIQRAFEEAIGDTKARRKIAFFVIASFVNICILVIVGSRSVTYMNSPEFCGTLCHKVMQPEYNAYKRSAHSRVDCVDCHIGPGASWATKAKINGLRQVWAVLTDSYHRPVPSPVKELRPARDTCEQCHWPAKFHGNRISFFTAYEDDQDNTPQVSAVALKVGGVNPKTKKFQGIHWHVSPDVEVQYEALDEKREVIGKITKLEKGKVVAEYELKDAKGKAQEKRSMDCVDCHNRPTHIYDNSPEAAVDDAFYEGRLPRSARYLRKMAVSVLKRDDYPREGIEATLFQELNKAYDANFPDFKPVEKNLKYYAKVLAELYLRNIYPDMKVTWDTYPTHLGHRGDEGDNRGCFRCHDNKHETKEGKVLSQDCELCHEILHMEEGIENLSDSLKALLPEAS